MQGGDDVVEVGKTGPEDGEQEAQSSCHLISAPSAPASVFFLSLYIILYSASQLSLTVGRIQSEAFVWVELLASSFPRRP